MSHDETSRRRGGLVVISTVDPDRVDPADLPANLPPELLDDLAAGAELARGRRAHNTAAAHEGVPARLLLRCTRAVALCVAYLSRPAGLSCESDVETR